MAYRKDTITLNVRVPRDVALLILGRLYGSGVLSKKQYEYKASQIDSQFAEKQKIKAEKLKKLLTVACS